MKHGREFIFDAYSGIKGLPISAFIYKNVITGCCNCSIKVKKKCTKI